MYLHVADCSVDFGLENCVGFILTLFQNGLSERYGDFFRGLDGG